MDTAEAIETCQSFANKHKLIFETEGECWFGRECVGFLSRGGNWLAFNPRSDEDFKLIDGLHNDDLYAPDIAARGDDRLNDGTSQSSCIVHPDLTPRASAIRGGIECSVSVRTSLHRAFPSRIVNALHGGDVPGNAISAI